MKTKQIKFILIPALSASAALLIVIPACICVQKTHVSFDSSVYLAYYKTDWKQNEPTAFCLDKFYLSNELTNDQTLYADIDVIHCDKGFSNFIYDSSKPCTYLGGDHHEFKTSEITVNSTRIPEWGEKASILTVSIKFKCINSDNKVIWEDSISKLFIGRDNRHD